MNAKMLNKLIVAAALAVGTGLFAADAPSKPDDKSKAAATASADTKKDAEKFNAQRDAMLADREALTKQLKAATAEQRKAIMEKLKDMDAAQRELSKQVTEDLRKLRQR
ncbi:MAG: hypothetical protein NTV51_18270 [Verrucomicrobia bacterium]|nr:hypothetical protein [Verrucomicrobiota bacterium]